MPDTPTPAPTVTLSAELHARTLLELANASEEREEAQRERAELRAFVAEAKPMLQEYAEWLAARRKKQAETDAETLEGLARWKRIALSPPFVAVASALLALAANYLLGMAGIAPASIRAALQEPSAQEVPHVPTDPDAVPAPTSITPGATAGADAG